MMELDSVKELLANPVTAIFGALGVLGGWLQMPLLDAVWGTLWTEAGALFAAFSVSATTLAPEIAWLPEGALQAAALGTGAIFVANRLNRVVRGLRSRLEEE
jgi:hypothetical protein